MVPRMSRPRATSLLLCSLALTLACGDSGGGTATDAATTDATTTAATADSTSGSSGADQPTTGEPSTGGSSTGELVLGDLLVEVNYAGAQVGTLSLAAVTSFPPMGPPLASVTDKAPVFPFMGTLKGLEPNDYYVAAVLDIGDNNPQQPGPEDLVAFTPMPTTIVGGDTPMVTLTLTDK